MKKTVCELFAGVGGFRLGLENSSKEWKTVWFNQWEPSKVTQWAHACYVKNFGDIKISKLNTCMDIEKVDKKKIPDHTLLVGGFPCQDYSVARSLSGEKGIEGKKGVLWWSIYDILKEKNPPFVILENVDRLLKSPSSQRGRDFGIILSCFNEQKYNVEWRVVNAADYGASQRRRRTFIFAYKSSTLFYDKTSTYKVDRILKKEGFFAKAFPILDEEYAINQIKLDYANILEVSNDFSYDFLNAGVLKDGVIYTTKVKEKAETPIPMKNILQNNLSNNMKYYSIEEKYFIPKEKLYYSNDGKRHYDEDIDDNYDEIKSTWQFLKGGKKRNRTSKTGHKYKFSEGPISFPDKIELPARTMLTSESSFNRSTHVIMDIESDKIRLITPIEAERLQGFHDNWTKYSKFDDEIKEMPEKTRYFCMGNALVVSMVTRMANQLNKIIEAED